MEKIIEGFIDNQNSEKKHSFIDFTDEIYRDLDISTMNKIPDIYREVEDSEFDLPVNPIAVYFNMRTLKYSYGIEVESHGFSPFLRIYSQIMTNRNRRPYDMTKDNVLIGFIEKYDDRHELLENIKANISLAKEKQKSVKRLPKWVTNWIDLNIVDQYVTPKTPDDDDDYSGYRILCFSWGSLAIGWEIRGWGKRRSYNLYSINLYSCKLHEYKLMIKDLKKIAKEYRIRLQRM
jgi:hypothetical protein